MKTLQRNECKILLRNREGKPCATVQDGILRRIASVLGVSHPTILNWLAQESGCKNLQPEATNAILGRDGKVYPAKKKPAVLLRSPDDIEAAGLLARASTSCADRRAGVLRKPC
jgi:hypothetical protein